MQSRTLAKSQSHAARLRSIERRVKPPGALEAQETVSPLRTSAEPRSKSYSKTSRNLHVNPAFQRLKTRILAHESSEILQNSPKLREETRVKRSPGSDSKDRAKLHESLILPRGFRVSSTSPFTARESKPSPRLNPLLQNELMSAGLLASSQQIPPWDLLHQKAYLKQLLRNIKQVEASKRNLWKNRLV